MDAAFYCCCQWYVLHQWCFWECSPLTIFNGVQRCKPRQHATALWPDRICSGSGAITCSGTLRPRHATQAVKHSPTIVPGSLRSSAQAPHPQSPLRRGKLCGGSWLLVTAGLLPQYRNARLHPRVFFKLSDHSTTQPPGFSSDCALNTRECP